MVQMYMVVRKTGAMAVGLQVHQAQFLQSIMALDQTYLLEFNVHPLERAHAKLYLRVH
jgi:hypothetical protein